MKAFLTILGFAVILLQSACNIIDKLANQPPLIETITAEKSICNVGDTVWVTVQANDPDGDPLTASWTSDGGYFLSAQGLHVDWVAPKIAGYYTLTVVVRDNRGGEGEDRISITVLLQEKPVVRITRPRDGEYFTALGHLTIEVTAAPIDFVGVEFYLDGNKQLDDTSPPFIMDWPLAGLSGVLRIKAIAYRLDAPAISAADSIRVNIEGVIPVPNVKGE